MGVEDSDLHFVLYSGLTSTATSTRVLQIGVNLGVNDGKSRRQKMRHRGATMQSLRKDSGNNNTCKGAQSPLPFPLARTYTHHATPHPSGRLFDQLVCFVLGNAHLGATFSFTESRV